jgi:hypothetical protein
LNAFIDTLSAEKISHPKDDINLDDFQNLQYRVWIEAFAKKTSGIGMSLSLKLMLGTDARPGAYLLTSPYPNSGLRYEVHF